MTMLLGAFTAYRHVYLVGGIWILFFGRGKDKHTFKHTFTQRTLVRQLVIHYQQLADRPVSQFVSLSVRQSARVMGDGLTMCVTFCIWCMCDL